MNSARLLVTIATALAMSLALGAGARSQTPAQGPSAAPQQKPETVILTTPPMPEQPNNGLGDTERPLIPGQQWRAADLNRPKPVTVTPGRHPGDPPSDAIVLFDGKDLSQWNVGGGGARGAAATPGATPAPTSPRRRCRGIERCARAAGFDDHQALLPGAAVLAFIPAAGMMRCAKPAAARAQSVAAGRDCNRTRGG